MGKRKIYTERYEKAINHLKTNSDIEEQYLFEAKNCLTQIKKIKGAKGIAITSYFNHIDFILRDIFGVEVEGVRESINRWYYGFLDILQIRWCS